MKIAATATLALATLSTLIGCGQDEPGPAVTTSTVQRCVYVVSVQGDVLLADDDECEDHPEKYVSGSVGPARAGVDPEAGC